MSIEFLNTLNKVFNSYSSDNNSTVTKECVSKIDHQMFYQLSLIPAVVITLSFGFTRKRRNMFLSCWGGRPGLVFPMDSLTRTSKISYACAFGATAFLVYDIVINQRLIITTPNDNAAKSFAGILSVLVYGMVFFPVFACLALSSVFGLVLGAPYVWMLLGVQIYKLTECETTAKGRLLLVLQSLPNLVCLVYLSVSIPNRIRAAWRKRHFLSCKKDTESSLKNIRQSYAGLYVSRLFQNAKVKVPAKGKPATVKGVVKTLIHRFVYRRKKDFRYPARILSVMLVGVMVVYILAFQFSVELPAKVARLEDVLLDVYKEDIGLEVRDNETEAVTNGRKFFTRVLYVLKTFRISMILAIGLASIFALLNVLHSLTSYRSNLLALYRGDHSHIPPTDVDTYVSDCINSIKYGGFQVGYIVWGFVIQFGVLTLVNFLVAILILFLTWGWYDWVIYLLELTWPVTLATVLIMMMQRLLAKFVFLQGRGTHFALDNRYCYFIFTYFMFFYNIFWGFFSCLLRILKAIVLGIAFIGRLDHSTLSRKFEFFDPGFSAYRGFMLMEYAHTHPVVIVFVRLVIHTWETVRDARPFPSAPSPSENLLLNMDLEDISDEVSDDTERGRRRSMKARCNWHVAYTLLHNPALRVTRKGFMQLLRQARELGLRIPIYDNQADIDTGLLADQILQARGQC